MAELPLPSPGLPLLPVPGPPLPLPELPLPAAAPPLPPPGPARGESRTVLLPLLPPVSLLHAEAAGRAPLPPCQLPATALLPAAVVGRRLPVAQRGAWQWLSMPNKASALAAAAAARCAKAASLRNSISWGKVLIRSTRAAKHKMAA